MWVKREEQKPRSERKPIPPDPFLTMHEGGGGGVGGGGKSPRIGGGGGTGGNFDAQLEAMNAAAQNSYNEVALFKCEWCGRSFLEDKLKIHNRSCTQEKPARRVDAKVRTGNPDVKLSSPSTGTSASRKSEGFDPSPPSYRPKTTGGSHSQGRSGNKIQIDEVFFDESRGGKPLAGNIGSGLATQNHRNNDGSHSSTSPRGQRLPQNEAPRGTEGGSRSKEEKIHLALTQLHDLEEANILMSRSIRDLKELIYTLQSDD